MRERKTVEWLSGQEAMAKARPRPMRKIRRRAEEAHQGFWLDEKESFLGGLTLTSNGINKT